MLIRHLALAIPSGRPIICGDAEREVERRIHHAGGVRSKGLAEVTIERRVRALLSGMAFLLLATGLAGAHPDPPAANPDSLKGKPFLDRIDFHPSYGTAYQINRTSRSWTNDLSFQRKISFFDLTHQMSLRNNQDNAQNGLHGKTGTMKTSLNYKTEGAGGWTIAASSNVKRSSQFSSFRDQVDNNSEYGVTGETNVFNSAMHRMLPLMRNFDLSTSSEAGYSVERSTSRRSNVLDSTRVGGVYQNYGLGLGGTIGSSLQLKTNFGSDRRLGDSRTLQYRKVRGVWRADSTMSRSKDTSDNRSRKLDANADWTPFKTLKWSSQAHTQHEINQYFDPLATGNPSQNGFETKDGRDDGAGTTLDWTPNSVTTLHGDFDYSKLEADFKVQPRGFTKRATKGSLDGRIKLPAITGPLQTTELHSNYSGSNTRNILQETGNYRQLEKTLRNEIRRSLWSKIQIAGTSEITLSQYFYDDKKNDRDEKRQLLDGILTYTPSQMWTGMFEVGTTVRNTVNVPSDKAANNNTTNSYKVSGEVDCKRGQMSIAQRYTIQADYTFYNFNENNNNLVRSNQVQTDFGHTIGSALAISLQHMYQFRDSGQFFREAGGTRAYIPSSKETEHQMTLTTSYPIGGILRVEARQMLDRRRNRIVRTGKITTNMRGEFSAKANIQQDFGDNFKVSASFQKTQSLTERNYWTVQAQVQRNF